jgi:hypothetical protein
MSDAAAVAVHPRTNSMTFLSVDHGDLTIEWDEGNNDAMTSQIQYLMDKGVTFFKIEDQGKVRKKLVGIPIGSAAEATDRKVLIKDADIAKIVDSGLADISRIAGVTEIKTTGRAATAAEAAGTDTVAVKPAKGG